MAATSAPVRVVLVLILAGLAALVVQLPLDTWGLAAAAAVLYAGLALPRPGWRLGRWLAARFVLVALSRLALAATALPLGLQAEYWASAAPSGAAERFPAAPPTQAALDLRGEDFSVGFFNDAARFNFGPDVQPGRDQLPFSVRFHGFLAVPSDGPRQLALDAAGPARVMLDGAPVLSTPDTAGVQRAQAQVPLAAGLHPIEVDYQRPVAVVPRLRLAWQAQPGGALETLAMPALRQQAVAGDAALQRALGTALAVALGALIVAWLALGLWAAWRRPAARWRAALGAVPLLFLGYGALLLGPMAGRTAILSGLDDWLIYESSARDILLNGLLMDGGQGHAAPYYGQPLYPYALALAHRLTGDGLFGPLVLQFAALGGVLVGTYALARRAFGAGLGGGEAASVWGSTHTPPAPRSLSQGAGGVHGAAPSHKGGGELDALAALAGCWGLVALAPEHVKIARQLFNENLYMPLVLLSLVALVGLARRRRPPAWWGALLVGGLLGVTAITRSQFLLCVPFALLILALAWRRAAALPLVALVLGLIIAIAPITARNWLVSGQLVLISSSGGASLLEFHRPPPGLIDPGSLDKDPLFNALHLDTSTRTVLAFIRADPLGYLRTLLPLGAHSVGLQGRNDPGSYWPLLVSCLLYALSFGLRRVRRLHVWPIHAFVLTHLVVLMLFEADTYGYRLVMPMYAPMLVPAMQVPLWLARRLSRAGRLRLPEIAGAGALAGVVALAIGQQTLALAQLWPQRDAAVHGLGGAAAQAAQAADAADAGAIYVASVDGTPRHFGAGVLTGLRYPWFKWFDPARTLPIPPPQVTAVYALSELAGHDVADAPLACLGAVGERDAVTLSGAQVRQQCLGDSASDAPLQALDVTFGDLARFEGARVPSMVAAGDRLDVELLWEPLQAHPADPQQVSLHLEDAQPTDAGSLQGNATLDLYPVQEWQPGEGQLSRLVLSTDPTAIPDTYRLTLGIGPAKPNAPPAMAVWNGARTDRVPLAQVRLGPAQNPAEVVLPPDMQPLPPSAEPAGGLQLVGIKAPSGQAAPGDRLPLSFLWRATQADPPARQAELQLVQQDGQVVQHTALPLFGGRLAPETLDAGQVLRDNEVLTLGASVPGGPATLRLQVLDQAGVALGEPWPLGTLQIKGRAHNLDPAAASLTPEAVFGDRLALLSHQLEPAQAAAGAKVTLHLRWRGLAEMPQAYKVFVHVLDPSGQRVVAQRDAEPQDGAAPTSGWLAGEVVDDSYQVTLPAQLAPGQYPIELGVYDPVSGARLPLADGDNRLLLQTRLEVR